MGAENDGGIHLDFNRDLSRVREWATQVSGGKASQVEATAGAKALK